MSDSSPIEEARRQCEALSHAYGACADAWEAERLANLFTADGVFDRLGTRIVGREAIARFIANRPREFWQRHHGSHFTFAMAADGQTATGTLDLVLEKGRVGSDAVIETVRARYHDQFQNAADGWRFRERQVRLIAE
jgi:hypothetical protein